MDLSEAYVGLGGNLGNAHHTILEALHLLKKNFSVRNLKASSFYKTSPVSVLPQNDYVNAVCKFETSLTPHALLKVLQDIEKRLGKEPKPKCAPRLIDCDILFFGNQSVSTPELEIPHPRWRERLFVLIPLFELTKTVRLPERNDLIDLQAELDAFRNHNNESVQLLNQHLMEMT